MPTAAALLAQARQGASLTQNALGVLSGLRQGFISRAERGHQDLTVTALNRLVHASGWKLTVLPTQSATVAETAQDCARWFKAGHEDGPYRAVIQLADDLAGEHGAERVALTVAPPVPTGDERFDAFIAGVTEHRLDEEDLPHPRWLATAACLDDLWFVDDSSINGQATIDATPPALRRRGVIINAEELVSV